MNVSALVTPAIKQATIRPRQPSPRKCWIAWPNKVSLACASLLAVRIEPRQHLGKRGKRDQAGERPGDRQQPLDEVAVDHAHPRFGLGLARAGCRHDVRLHDHAHEAQDRHRDHEPGVAFLRLGGAVIAKNAGASFVVQARQATNDAQARGHQQAARAQ